MDISALCSYICWQDDSINIPPTTENLRNHFRIILRFRYQGQNPDDVGVLHSYQLPFFWCSDRVLSGDEEYRRIFVLKLVPSGLPRSVQESIVNDLNILAHSMVKDHKNLDRKILPIAVDVVIRSEAVALARVNLEVRAMELRRVRARRHDDDDVIARATRESMEVVKFVPATKSSIEALEKLTILNNNSCLEVDQQCRICLETLPIGAEVTCMPCSHIFHGNCIVRWLECSNLCPLCRFAMPC